MSVASDRIFPRLDAAGRCERILDAAELCFARQGFHRSTMQDIGREVEMSQGNIYRYFPSKDSIVLALEERESVRAAALIARLEQVGDKRTALLGLIKEYFVDCSRTLAVLRVDLWSEVTRNSVIGLKTQINDKALRDWLCDTLAALAPSPGTDVDALARLLCTHLNGLVAERAILEHFDRDVALAQVIALIDAGLAGSLGAPQDGPQGT